MSFFYFYSRKSIYEQQPRTLSDRSSSLKSKERPHRRSQTQAIFFPTETIVLYKDKTRINCDTEKSSNLTTTCYENRFILWAELHCINSGVFLVQFTAGRASATARESACSPCHRASSRSSRSKRKFYRLNRNDDRTSSFCSIWIFYVKGKSKPCVSG